MIATFPSKHYDIDQYPAIKKHLLSYGKERLEQTGKIHIINDIEINSRKKTNNKWFETQDSTNYSEDFSKQKIAWGNLCLHAQYSFVEETYFVNNPANIIVPGDKYLLALLNSKLADFYIRTLGVTRNGGYFEYKPMFVEKLPAKFPCKRQKELIIGLCNTLIETQADASCTIEIENEIDLAFFNIYGLDQHEKYVLFKRENNSR